MTLLKEGNVTITATWTEQSISCTTNITVTKSSINVIATISGSDTLRINKTKTWSVSFTDENGATVSDFTDFEWNVVPSGFDVGKFTTNTVDGTSITLKLNDNSLVDNTFNLQIIQTSTSKVLTEKEIYIIEEY